MSGIFRFQPVSPLTTTARRPDRESRWSSPNPTSTPRCGRRSAVGEITDAFGGEPTPELWRALGEHGFIGINIPEAHGGGGAPHPLAEAEIQIELAAVDAAIQAHGGNGISSEYGLMPLWGMARLLRMAPVNRN